jgi:hypothetical protein
MERRNAFSLVPGGIAGRVASCVEAREVTSPHDPTAVASGPRGLLPEYRILSYYGHPMFGALGILGRYKPDELLVKLKEQAAAYETADPTRQVVLAFELIASLATRDSGSDGTYRTRTSPALLDIYADFTAAHGIELILDLQVGRSPLGEEIDAILPWLGQSHVHLALDPEWALGEGEIPREHLGGFDAAEITQAQETLASLAAETGVRPKLLIIHQFLRQMIREKAALAPVPGVQLVIVMDGVGSPHTKIISYNVFVRYQPVEFGGIKLFYQEEGPLLTPEQVLALTPPPDVVIYQ